MTRVFFRLAAIAMVVMLTVAPSYAATELLVNGGFEDGGGSYNGWFTFGAGVQLSLPAGDNIIRTGAAASKVYGEYTNCPGLPQFDVGGYGQAFTPTSGWVYEFSGYSFISVADTIPGTDTCNGNRLIAKVVFFNAASGGAEISSNEVILGDWSTARDQWIPFSISIPAPAGALRVEALILFLQPGCDDGSVFVDDLSFQEIVPTPAEPNVLVNPSFDTDLTGWTTFGNVYYDGRSWARRTATGGAKLFGTFTPNSDSGMYQSFATTPGRDWKLEVYALTTCVEDPVYGTNDNVAVATISFLDGTATEVGSADAVLVDNTAPLGTWTKHTVLATAPAGTVEARAYVLFVQQPTTLLGGAAWVDDALFRDVTPTGIGDGPTAGAYALEQNVPNPFNPSTVIHYTVPDGGGYVALRVYDVSGRLVRTLVDGHQAPGEGSAAWNGRDDAGSPVATGVYFYRMEAPGFSQTRKMVMLK